MPAANAYRAKTVTFGSAVLGISDVAISDSGSTTDLTTDASPTVTAVFMDSLVTEVTVTTTDINRTTTITKGATGSLAVVYELRAAGSGAGAGDKTATMANAVVVSVATSASTNGIGSVTVTFRCAGPSGSTIAWT